MAVKRYPAKNVLSSATASYKLQTVVHEKKVGIPYDTIHRLKRFDAVCSQVVFHDEIFRVILVYCISMTSIN